MKFWTIFFFVFVLITFATGEFSSSYEESEEGPKTQRGPLQKGKQEASSYEESSE